MTRARNILLLNITAYLQQYQMKDFSYITNSHPDYIESQYKSYVKDPNSIDPELRKFFDGYDFAINEGTAQDVENTIPKEQSNGSANLFTDTSSPNGAEMDFEKLQKEFGVLMLIRAYRKRAHLIATTNPIRPRKDRKANLELENFGLNSIDLNTSFYAATYLGLPVTRLQDILDFLKKVYASNIGLEYTYINDQEVCEWVQENFEALMSEQQSLETSRRILEGLNEGVIFEKFLHTKYIGQKRFSLEGGESTIPALDFMINTAGDMGVKEVVIGMAHRGRLNILANILNKTYEDIFNEFEGNIEPEQTMGSGDVKYHLGFRSNITTPTGKEVNVQLAPNPSHLETVSPVMIGFARAKADRLYESDYDSILPIIIHGDASIAGQGVVYEISQMSKLKGYYVGGSIHFVINNQIGFTTDFDDARSGDYCTSIASMTQSPVLHINGDDPEAVVKAAIFAVRFRQKFNTDIYLDMVCYRRHGHNEGDDPKFTQPKLYQLISKHKNPREIYISKLSSRDDGTEELAKEMENKYWTNLQDRLDEVKQNAVNYDSQEPELEWKALQKADESHFKSNPTTKISEAEFKSIFTAIMAVPNGFNALRKITKILNEKIKNFDENGTVDWATGELLAYASLCAEGYNVRMSGQDVQRGTFSHRHAVLHDDENGHVYNRLSQLNENQGEFMIYNSLLSEYAVLGFEYGYAMALPSTLTIWEAQFGDFCNGAQIVIDQYITSAEMKWNRMNGLVLLLPHGYEGQGPEHSSARMERFLQSAAEYNMILTNCTTAANFFHVLRRQMKYNFRKPLINFSPKANLRHHRAYSPMIDFTEGGFQELIDDPYVDDPSAVTRVLLCSGKIYFDLSEKQMEDNRKDVAIVRLEQLYPLRQDLLEKLTQKYSNATWFWVQEEPRNMGAASYLKMNLDKIPIGYISRNASAATATGYAKQHKKEQNLIIEMAFK